MKRLLNYGCALSRLRFANYGCALSRLRFANYGCALSRLRFANYGCALSRLRFAYASAVLVLIAFPAAGQIAPNQHQAHQAMLNTYCISCHNSRAKVGGLVLEGLDLQAAADNAEI